MHWTTHNEFGYISICWIIIIWVIKWLTSVGAAGSKVGVGLVVDEVLLPVFGVISLGL